MPEDVREEFARAAAGFAERTAGRFDDLNVVEFSRVGPGSTVVEVGAGTGNFLSLFAGLADCLVAVDITSEMLLEARKRYPSMNLVLGNGLCLPLRSRSADLVTSAQMLHHVHDPIPIIKEMRRVAAPSGTILIVDQVATESFEQARAMTHLEKLRDPTHAVSRPPSAFRTMLLAAGLEIADERVIESRQRLDEWMWPGEFPPERIAAVEGAIETEAGLTGQDFEKVQGVWTFTRRRVMLLANIPRAGRGYG